LFEADYLSLKNLKIHYGSLEAVNDVSFEVPLGKVVSLLGANGSGKSTVLKAVSGLKKLTRGEIWFQGKRIDGKAPQEIILKGIAHVPERRGLFPYMTVFENLLMGAYSRKKATKQEIERDREIYDHFSILGKKEKSAVTLVAARPAVGHCALHGQTKAASWTTPSGDIPSREEIAT
jgi:branched-chain amino acid transport system ATP-binding protein